MLSFVTKLVGKLSPNISGLRLDPLVNTSNDEGVHIRRRHPVVQHGVFCVKESPLIAYSTNTGVDVRRPRLPEDDAIHGPTNRNDGFASLTSPVAGL
jgi:hypothetical protein